MADQHYKVIISADGQQLRGEFQRLVPTIRTANTTLGTTDIKARHAGQSLEFATRQTNQTSAALQRLGHYGSAAFVGWQVASVMRDALNTTAVLQDLETRLRSLSGTSAAYAANREFLIELGERHHKTLIGLSGAYADLLALEQNQIITSQESRTILEGMSNAASALGASNQQLEDSFYGLAQGIASPIVAMEEIKQVTDPLPGLLQKIEKSAGLGGGGLRKLAADGAITSDFFKTHLIKALQDYDGEAAKTADNISAKTRDLSREYELFISMLDKPIGGAANAALDAMAHTLAFLRENSDLATGALVVLGARGVASLTNVTAAQIKSAAASRMARKEDTLKAIEAHKLAQAELAAAQASLQKAQAQKAGALSSVASLNRVKTAQDRLTIAQQNYAASSNSAALASANLSTKTKLLRGAGALIGGPAGAFTLAAVAIASFASSARAGAPDIANLKREVDLLLGNHAEMRKDDLSEGLEKQKAAAQALELQLSRLNAQHKAIKQGVSNNHSQFNFKVDEAALIKNQQAIEKAEKDLKATLGHISKLQLELNKPIAQPAQSSASPTGDYAAQIKAQQDAKENARRQKQGQEQLGRLEYELLAEEQKIIVSYERRKELIINNTQEGSAKRQQLLRDASGRYIEELRQVYEQEKALEDDKNRAVVASAKQAAMQKKQALQDSMQSMGQIFGNMSQILMEGNKKQFDQGKKMAQAQAAINGSLAFIKALTAGPILGPILAGTIAAMTGIQMAKINQQQYQPVAHGGMTYNPDERSVTITKGERVVSPRQNQDLMAYLDGQNSNAGVGKNNLVQNFNFQSFNPSEAAQILRGVRGKMGSMAMKQAS